MGEPRQNDACSILKSQPATCIGVSGEFCQSYNASSEAYTQHCGSTAFHHDSLLYDTGTTLFAILKYGNDDRHQENPEEHPGNLEVGYGGAPKTHKEKRHGNRHLETPGSAFSFFLGGGRGGSGNDSSGDGENKVGGSVRRAERMTTGEPKTVRCESDRPCQGMVRSRSRLLKS